MGPSRVPAPSPCWMQGLLSQWNPWCPSPLSSFLFARNSWCGGVAWEPKDSWTSLEGISAFHSHSNLIYKPVYEHWWQNPPFIKGWCISFVTSLKFKCWVGVENFLQLFWEMVQVFVGDTVFLFSVTVTKYSQQSRWSCVALRHTEGEGVGLLGQWSPEPEGSSCQFSLVIRHSQSPWALSKRLFSLLFFFLLYPGDMSNEILFILQM